MGYNLEGTSYLDDFEYLELPVRKTEKIISGLKEYRKKKALRNNQDAVDYCDNRLPPLEAMLDVYKKSIDENYVNDLAPLIYFLSEKIVINFESPMSSLEFFYGCKPLQSVSELSAHYQEKFEAGKKLIEKAKGHYENLPQNGKDDLLFWLGKYGFAAFNCRTIEVKPGSTQESFISEHNIKVTPCFPDISNLSLSTQKSLYTTFGEKLLVEIGIANEVTLEIY